jgi:NAD(P)H-flavin reductase
LKEQLDNFAKSTNFSFKVYYTIDKYEDGWDGLTGHIDKEMIIKYLPQGNDTLYLLCGRKSMCKKYLTPILTELGHEGENIFIF